MVRALLRLLVGRLASSEAPAARQGEDTSEYAVTGLTTIVGVLVGIVALVVPGTPEEALTVVLVWIVGLVIPSSVYTAGRSYVKSGRARLLEELRELGDARVPSPTIPDVPFSDPIEGSQE